MKILKSLSGQWKLLACFTALSLITGSGIRFGMGELASVHAQTSTVAFTATIVKKVYDSKDKETVTYSTIFARRGSGSTVSIRDAYKDGQSSRSTAIQSVEEMSIINAFNESKVKMTTQLTQAHLDRLRANDTTACSSGSVQPPHRMLGLDVAIKSDTQAGADGKKALVELWLSPKLGCFPIKEERRVIDASGALVVRESIEVVNVRLGEPNPALFTIPNDFVERTPSVAYAAEATRLGDTDCRTCSSKVLANADARYLNSK